VGRTGFATRAFSGLQGGEGARWAERNRLTAALFFSHNLHEIVPSELFSRHPEFFPWVEGKRLNPGPGVFYWNPDIARPDLAAYAADKARAYFAQYPREPAFALGINDALLWGESPELLQLVQPMRWFRERPDYADAVMTFMNRAAEDLGRTDPERYLGCLAYYWVENLPTMPVHPRVIPFLTADRSQGYDRSFWAEEMDLQRRWGLAAGTPRPDGKPNLGGNAAGRRLGLYDYLYGGSFLIPRQHTRYLAEHLQHAWRAGFTDYYAEAYPNWGLDGPMPWLAAQLLQNPEQAPEALLQEFYGRYFQGAAVSMRRFFERCEELWTQQPGPSYWLKHYRNESQAVVFPSTVLPELRAGLDDAARQANSPLIRARVDLVRDAFGVTERFVRFKESKDALLRSALPAAVLPAREIAADIRRALVEQLNEYRLRRADFIRYTHDLQRREPLALHSITWVDYLRNDPEPLARSLLSPEKLASISRERLVDPGMSGGLQPKRVIAGLTYGVALPSPWVGRVEPGQHHRAELVGAPLARVLRIEGSRDTQVQQWAARGDSDLGVAEVSVRGRVSPGTAVLLAIALLDKDQRHLAVRSVRLPDGDWPNEVRLRQLIDIPPRAAWVGMSIRVQNQVAGDWIEARGFSLRF
jgi:hypothetical protein